MSVHFPSLCIKDTGLWKLICSNHLEPVRRVSAQTLTFFHMSLSFLESFSYRFGGLCRLPASWTCTCISSLSFFYSYRFLGRQCIGSVKVQAKLKWNARGYYMLLYYPRCFVGSFPKWRPGALFFVSWFDPERAFSPAFQVQTKARAIQVFGIMWVQQCHFYHPWLGMIYTTYLWWFAGWFILVVGIVGLHHRATVDDWYRRAELEPLDLQVESTIASTIDVNLGNLWTVRELNLIHSILKEIISTFLMFLNGSAHPSWYMVDTTGTIHAHWDKLLVICGLCSIHFPYS